jgi:hypothetical protein
MKALALLLFTSTTMFSQQQAQQPVQQPQQTAPAAAPLPDLGLILASIEQTATSTASQIQAMRIDKWKTESSQRQQSQQNADSVVRNLTAALPTMVAAARSAPQNFTPNFKLYRNLTALYDVMLPLTESAGAFGPKGEFQGIGQQLQRWDEIRRSYGDYLERLGQQKDAAATAARANAAPAKPKKIIVDDEPTPPSKKKKK